jgi:hypothetical protein
MVQRAGLLHSAGEDVLIELFDRRQPYPAVAATEGLYTPVAEP